MSLLENVSPAYSTEDGARVEAVAKTLMEAFHGRVLEGEAAERTTLRALALKGEPRAAQCVMVAGVIVNYLREELDQ